MNECAVCGAERELLVSGLAKAGGQLQPLPAKMLEKSPMGASLAVCPDNPECLSQVRFTR